MRKILHIKNGVCKYLLLLLLIFFIFHAEDCIAAPTNMLKIDQTFSVAQITDTQFLSASYSQLYTNLTDWIIFHNATYNIKMVIHTGDIVDSGNDLSQWTNANASMSRLQEADIPYCWDAGNHDQTSTGTYYGGNPNGEWLGSQFLAFNATNMHQQKYWVSDINDGKNTAVKFTCNNSSFLVINLEFHANQTAIDWMTNLIETHPKCHVIVATHSYLNGLGGYGYPKSPGTPDWELRLRETLDKHPSVFLVLSGHYIPTQTPLDAYAETAYISYVGNREETFFNRQCANNNQGANSVELFTFDLNDQSLTPKITTYDLCPSSAKPQNLGNPYPEYPPLLPNISPNSHPVAVEPSVDLSQVTAIEAHFPASTSIPTTSSNETPISTASPICSPTLMLPTPLPTSTLEPTQIISVSPKSTESESTPVSIVSITTLGVTAIFLPLAVILYSKRKRGF